MRHVEEKKFKEKCNKERSTYTCMIYIFFSRQYICTCILFEDNIWGWDVNHVLSNFEFLFLFKIKKIMVSDRFDVPISKIIF